MPMMPPPRRPLQRRHIEALVAVGDFLSVHRAARSLDMPQPVLSRLLAEAEALIGARLFDRSSHGSTPTAQGEAILARARVVLRGIQRLNDAAASSQPPIRLGCIPRAMRTLVPRVLMRMYPQAPAAQQAAEPPFRVRVQEDSSRVLFDALAAGSLDFAVLRPTARTAGSGADELVVERLYDERTVIVCSADHPGVAHGPVPLARLAGHDWLLPQADTTSRVAFDEFWAAHGLPQIRPVMEARSSESTPALIAGTRLLSIAPDFVARGHAELGVLRILPVRRALPANPVMLAFHGSLRDDPLLDGFRRLLHDTAQELDVRQWPGRPARRRPAASAAAAGRAAPSPRSA